MTRTGVANILKDAAVSYFSHKRYSCFKEIAVNRWGKLRADVLAVSMKGEVILTECKSCAADYRADSKWTKYIPYCDKMYFCMSQKTFRCLRTTLLVDLKGTGVGVMVLGESGYLENRVPAKQQILEERVRQSLILRMAWRAGESRRTRPRRVRFFLEESK